MGFSLAQIAAVWLYVISIRKSIHYLFIHPFIYFLVLSIKTSFEIQSWYTTNINQPSKTVKQIPFY